MTRTIYKEVKTINGREIITRECDCDIARRERRQDKEPHRAWMYESHYTSPGMQQMTCSKTSMTVWV